MVFDHASIKVHHKYFLLLAIPNALDHSRLGIVVAKKNTRLAVQRNRTKRAIRETFRKKQHTLFSIDAIVLARRGSDQLTNDELVEIIDGLCKQAAKKARKIKELASNDG